MLGYEVMDLLKVDLVIGVDGIKSCICLCLNGFEMLFFIKQIVWCVLILLEFGVVLVSQVFMGLGWYLVSYLLVKGLCNIVVVVECLDWYDEGWFYFGDLIELCVVFVYFGGLVLGWLVQV